MKISRGLTATVGAAVLAAGMTTGMATAAPAAAASTGTAGHSTAGGTGWHWVNEGWEPVPEEDTTLPAARYCKTFDLALDTVSADVRGKVLSRWDNGNAKDTYYNAGVEFQITKGFKLAGVWKHENAEKSVTTPLPLHVQSVKTNEIGVFGELSF